MPAAHAASADACRCPPPSAAAHRLPSAAFLGLQGSARVQVEQRGSEGEGFGKGRKVAMSFRQALQRMAGGDTSLYLTTQAVATAPDGHPALYASPVAELAADFPLVPQIMGRLVPQSINLWMGAAVDGEGLAVNWLAGWLAGQAGLAD